MPEVELPAVRGDWLTYAHPRQQFCQVLEAVGGRAIEVGHPDAIKPALEGVESYRQAASVWSLVPAVPSLGGDWDARGRSAPTGVYWTTALCLVRLEWPRTERCGWRTT